jgi:flagellar hook-associated protein 2
MTLPLFNIGGLATGLDTKTIIKQLMDIEAIPVNQLKQQKSVYQARDTAWQQVLARVKAFQQKIAAVADRSAWGKHASATSSNPDAVGVTVAGSPSPTSISFTVSRLASTHQVKADTVFTSGNDLVGAGTLTLTVDGTDHTVVTTATTTLNDLRGQINALGAGVSASVLTVDANQVRLVLTSNPSGDLGQFTASGTQATLVGFTVAQTGLDAQLTVGSGGGAIAIERASNTITDLVAGLTINLKATSASAVTISADRDPEAAIKAVKEMVTELNATISTVASLSAYNAETKTAAPLTGDNTARRMLLDIRKAVSGAVAGLTGNYLAAGDVGVSLNRGGTVAVDEIKLRAALEKDFDGVMAVFARTGTTTDARATYASSTKDTVDGTYAITITTAAVKASVLGSVYAAPGADSTFTITSGSLVASVTINTGDDLTTAVGRINTALAAVGITTNAATASSGKISLDESRYGTDASFTVAANDFGLAGTFSGVNVAGTIGGNAATGSGSALTGTTLNTKGIALAVTASAADVAGAGGSLGLGSVSVITGFGKGLQDLVDRLDDSDTGIDVARDGAQAQISRIDKRIEAMEARLERKNGALIRQFAALEVAMSRLQAMSSSLTSQLAGLPKSQS